MARVLVKCPATNLTLPSGLEVDPENWDGRQIGLNFAWCPECKITHAWTKRDAWLEEATDLVHMPQ